MLVHVNEQNLYNSAVSKNCQVNSLSSGTKTEDNSASARSVSCLVQIVMGAMEINWEDYLWTKYM